MSESQNLSESELQLRAIYESALDAFLIADDDGRYLTANPAACALLGGTEADIRGRLVSDFMAPGFDFQQVWSAFLEQGSSRGDLVLVRADGSSRTVEFNAIANVLPGRHLSILRDVTDRKRAEDALELLAETGQLFSESLDYVVTLQNVSQLAVPLLGDWCMLDLLSEEGVLERLVTVHSDPAKQPLVEALKRFPPRVDTALNTAAILRSGQPLFLPELAAGQLESASRGAEHLRAIQALEPRSVLGVPLIARGRALGVWRFIRSHPGQSYSEADLRLAESLARRAALAIDNARLYRKAEAANQAKDQFLATLSHELRTPLTPVLALLSKLEAGAGPGDEPLRRGLSIIRKNVELEARLIDDLLDITRIARGKIELHREVTHVHPLLWHAIGTCCADAVAAGRLSVETDLRAPEPRAWADGPRLTQVFWNLLSNAVKFTPAGGTIRVRTDVQWAEAAAPGEAGGGRALVVEVSDTGAGIEPEVLPRIFNAFAQGRLDTAQQLGGLGLGLAISKAILDVHGGSLSASSEGRGRGTTFTVRLPLYDGPEEARTPPGEAGLGAAERPLSILLVEDHADTAEVIAELLRDRGHRVVVAGSVAAGLEAAAGEMRPAAAGEMRPAAGAGIDLVISDLGLPDGSGLDLMRALKERYGLNGIAFSGYGTDEDRRQSAAAGFAAHLTKPVTFEALLDAIRRIGLVPGSSQ
jgi:PAS domain S-box-containing protein